MVSVPTFQSNPYGSFDPSQWTNPYSQFSGQALPWPSSYAGWPTNARGQPIGQPPGMTLNNTPAAPAAPAPAAPQSMPSGPSNVMLGSSSGVGPGGIGAGSPNTIGANLPWLNGQGAPGGPGSTPIGAPPAAPAAAPAAASGQPSYQQVLAMLANPGKVTTPGATAPQAQSATSLNPGVLQSFLQNWKPQQSGPGSGFTQNFNTILRGLQGG